MIRFIFNIFIIFSAFKLQAQDKNKIDSLLIELEKEKIDTSRVNIILSLSENFQRVDIDTSMLFAKQADEIAQKIKYPKGLANAAHCIGIVYVYKGEYDSCLKYWNKCLELRIKLNDLKGISGTYNNIGVVYKNQGKYEQAIQYFQKALEIFEKRNDSLNISNCLSNMGSIQDDLKNYTLALEYFQSSLEIKKILGNEKDIASCLMNIGSVYKDNSNLEKAFEYYKNSLKIFEKISDKRGIASCYSNIGTYYEMYENFKLAIEYYEKAITIKEVLGDKYGISLLFSNLANINIRLADSKNITKQQAEQYYKESVKYSSQALTLAKETSSLPRVNTAYQALYKGWGKLNNYKKAFEYAELFININDSLLSTEKAKILEEMEAKYQSEKKQLNIEKLENEKKLQNETIARKDAENRKQRILIFSFIAGFITILIFSILLFRLFTQKKKAFKLLSLKNEEILQKNEEINTQKEEIESQRDIVILQKEHIETIHKEVTDSINYAKYIQEAVIPSNLKIDKLLDDYFILFKPKNIVSGDFYWITNVNEWLIIAVADCTGHGVPGAFMSMLGISFLNEIVRKQEVKQANEVLNLLRISIIDALSQTGKNEEQKDGMDISLVVIKSQIPSFKSKVPSSELLESYNAQWAGANNPLWIIRNIKNLSGLKENKDLLNFQNLANLEEFKGDKMPIAIHDNMIDFTNHELILQKDDIIYLMTDGYEDQFGGTKGRKFLSKNLKQLLIANCQLSMEEQKQVLEKTLNEWIGEGEQIDDITVLGIRI
ncbi:MAG: hypothetical protein A2046_14020 [Bacteroidetes bacterium GWA2_30_7]|nr:MAG: hypothetical protein A2046_14020 [Bacteroidetes bacterium GWA2_30_7]